MELTQTNWRQILTERCGTEAQHKLQSARVAVVGLGGLGSNMTTLLVRMGVENLHLIDFDKVDASNIHRQQYFLSQLGMYKTEAICQTLRQINPFVNLRINNIKLSEKNLKQLLAEDEIICEALDIAESKAMLVSEVLYNFSDKIVVAASGMAGVGESNLITTKRINRRLYVCGDGSSDCAQASLTAPRVALCAAHQANLVQRLILGLEE